MLSEFYPQLKSLHIFCVLLSGSLFAIRGMLMLADSAWSQHRSVKHFSYANDSALLSAGLALMYLSGQYPGSHAWLSVKLSLLVLYIGLGIVALRLGRSKAQRGVCLVAALCVYLLMLSIARTHHPLGILATHTLFQGSGSGS